MSKCDLWCYDYRSEGKDPACDEVFPGRLRLLETPRQGGFAGKWVEVLRLGVSRRSFLGLSTTCTLDLNANWQERSAQAFALLGGE